MIDNTKLLLSIVEQAKMPGAVIEPTELLARIREQENPTGAIDDLDRGSIIFGTLEKNLGFVGRCRFQGAKLDAEENEAWVSLIRWLIRELREWRETVDSSYHMLTALIVVAQVSDFELVLWDALPDDIGQNEALFTTLTRLAAGIRCEFKTRGSLPEPIWERDAVDRLIQADSQQDWDAVDQLWTGFESAVCPSVFQAHLTRCLARFHFNKLVHATQGVDQIMVAMQFASALKIQDRFKLGLATRNTRIQFACVYQTFIEPPSPVLILAKTEEQLSELLLAVSQDEQPWKKWMTVFNRYPLRYPLLQPALGKALAKVPDGAMREYVESISLSSRRDGSREAIGACLHTFRSIAKEVRRSYLWSLVFKRWSDWNFDVENSETHLFDIGFSELDYGVVAYAVECLGEQQRADAAKRIYDQLSTLDNLWHKSSLDCITGWNRLLSELQPFAHADQVVRSAQDLLFKVPYRLEALRADRYMQLMYATK